MTDPCRMPAAFIGQGGLCAATGEAAHPFAQGCTRGSPSMTSYLLGMAARARSGDDAQWLPARMPPERTNP
jgi:hypothetical protein